MFDLQNTKTIVSIVEHDDLRRREERARLQVINAFEAVEQHITDRGCQAELRKLGA